MKNKKITGVISLFLLFALLIPFISATNVEAQGTLNGCYNASGVARTTANSKANDFCYSLDGSLTATTFEEYQANLMFGGELNGGFGQFSGTNTIQLRLPGNAAPVPTQNPVEPQILTTPNASEEDQDDLSSDGDSGFDFRQFFGMESPQPQLPENTTPEPTQETTEVQTPLDPQENDQDDLSSDGDSGFDFREFFGMGSPQPQLSDEATPAQTLTTVDPLEEDQNGLTSDEDSGFDFRQFFGMGNPQPQLSDEATPEPTQEPVEKQIMMSVPIVGTPTKLIGNYPSQGEIYQSTEVTFVWSFDSVGVDTVPTSFTLVLDGVGISVTPTCDISSCQTTRTVPTGNHSWYVNAQSGTWNISSSIIYFSVVSTSAVAPAKPVLYSPSGSGSSQSVQLTWLPAANATSYTVTWWGAANGSGALPAGDESCKTGFCNLPVGSLADGSYTWTVTATNATGSAVSDPMSFTLVAPVSAPGKPSLVKPNGSYTSSTVNFVFKPAANAESYQVTWLSQWGQTGTKTLSASDSTCLSGDCYVSDVMPSIGSFSWYVTASNSAGSTKSDTMYFTINLEVSAPTGYSPSGTVSNNQPFTYTFSKVQDNTYQYNVRVYKAYSNTQVGDYYWNVSDLSCSGGYCSGTASSTLDSGSYYWMVRARTNNDVSSWSSPVYFNTNTYTYTPNTVPTPFSPVGIIKTATPIFSWKPITGATAYWITVYDSSNKSIFSGYTDNSVCSYQSCSYSPDFKLPVAGNYSWRITGGTSTGVIWNYATAAFSYEATEPLEKVELLSPADNGEIYVNEARIVWVDPLDKADSFKLVIRDESGAALLNTTLDREAAWCDNETCTIEFSQIPLHVLYTLEITPVSSSGESGETTSLNFQITDVPLDFAALYPMENQRADEMTVFSWRLPSNTPKDSQTALTYQVRLVDQTANREAIMGPYTCDSKELVCYDGGAYIKLTEPLDKGSYQWGVQVKELSKVDGPISFVIE